MVLPLAITAAALAAPAAAPVADCDQAATPIGTETRPGSLRFGALSVYGKEYVADEPRESFEPNADGEYAGWKMAVVLGRGRKARLRVAERDRRNASLLYARPLPAGQTFRISEGRSVERFHACDDREWTPWPGYIGVRGARCITLEGRVGRGEWISRRVRFGKRTCRRAG